MPKHKHYAKNTKNNERAKEMERFKQARAIRRAMRPLPAKVAAPYLEQEPPEDYVIKVTKHSAFYEHKMAILKGLGIK
jgi:hypothetical protein